MAPFVEMRGLSLRRGDTRILQPIDLSIAKGEFVAIIGPSGASEGVRPDANPGEEVTLSIFRKFIWSDILNAPFVNVARCY